MDVDCGLVARPLGRSGEAQGKAPSKGCDWGCRTYLALWGDPKLGVTNRPHKRVM